MEREGRKIERKREKKREKERKKREKEVTSKESSYAHNPTSYWTKTLLRGDGSKPFPD